MTAVSYSTQLFTPLLRPYALHFPNPVDTTSTGPFFLFEPSHSTSPKASSAWTPTCAPFQGALDSWAVPRTSSGLLPLCLDSREDMERTVGYAEAEEAASLRESTSHET